MHSTTTEHATIRVAFRTAKVALADALTFALAVTFAERKTTLLCRPTLTVLKQVVQRNAGCVELPQAAHRPSPLDDERWTMDEVIWLQKRGDCLVACWIKLPASFGLPNGRQVNFENCFVGSFTCRFCFALPLSETVVRTRFRLSSNCLATAADDSNQLFRRGPFSKTP